LKKVYAVMHGQKNIKLWECILNSNDENDNSVCSRTLLGR